MNSEKIQSMEDVFMSVGMKAPKLQKLDEETLKFRCALVNMTSFLLSNLKSGLEESEGKISEREFLHSIIARGNLEVFPLDDLLLTDDAYRLSTEFYTSAQEKVDATCISDAVELIASFSKEESTHNLKLRKKLSMEEREELFNETRKGR